MIKFIPAAIAAAVGFAISGGVMAQTVSRADYKAQMDHIASEYASDKVNCGSLSGNANDVCMAEASGRQRIAKVDLDARDNDTNEARYAALVTKAEADYSVAKEKCDDKSGNLKDICMNEAEAAETAAKADAKSRMKISVATGKASKESADTRRDTDMEKRDASYAVAK